MYITSYFKTKIERLNVHPLFYHLLAYIFGIWMQSAENTHDHLRVFCIGIFILLTLVLTSYTGQKNNKLLLLGLLVTSVSGYGLAFYQKREHQSFTRYLKQKIDIIGRIDDLCENEHPRIKNTITLQITKIKFPEENSWQSIKKNIYIYTYKQVSAEVGDIISTQNIQIKQPKDNSFTSYLIKQNIWGTVFANSLDYTFIKRPETSLWRLIHNKRQQLFNQIRQKTNSYTTTLFASLFLGNRTINKKEVESKAEQFKRWGISHYLARSGLHLVIFVMIWQWIFSFIPLHLFFKELILLFLSCIYFALSWPSISFIRAFCSYFCYKSFILCRIQSHFLHTLTLICLCTLIYNPIQLFFLDFQLSFGLTFALAWFNHIYRKK